MRECFCFASGPSLTVADVEIVRHWRAAAPDRSVIVANTTFRLALWADALYAMDRAWWKIYGDEVKKNFSGARLSSAPQEPKFDVEVLQRPAFDPYSNSGAGAVSYALMKGAKRIYLLGYDCQRIAGKSHWHGDHPKPLSNLGSIGQWQKFFTRLAATAKVKEAEIINCSRTTMLEAFPRRSLDEVCADVKREAA